MNLLNIKLIGLLLVLTALPLPVSAAYTIDGDLSDWGVTPFTDWAPNSSTTDYVVEDYQGTAATLDPDMQPYGGATDPTNEAFDIEAMYFDDTQDFGYFAIVTSMNESGVIWKNSQWDAADLAIDMDNDATTGEYGYEYGIKLIGSNKGEVCYLPDWQPANVYGANGPTVFTCNGTGSVIMGSANIVYADSGIVESWGTPYNKTYIIELEVNRTFLGSPSQGQLSDLHATLMCGNDVLRINDFSWSAPAFPAAAVPLGIVLFAPVAAYIAARRDN